MKHNMTIAQWHEHLRPVLAAAAAGKTIETAESMDSENWSMCGGKNFNTNQVYRVKQSKRFCNGVELDPHVEQLKSSRVYLADPTQLNGVSPLVITSMHHAEYASTLTALCNFGIMYDNPESAAKHGLAMRLTTEE